MIWKNPINSTEHFPIWIVDFTRYRLKKILGYFNRNQVLIIRNQNLRGNLNGTLKQVSNFLSISKFGHIKHKEVHSIKYKTKLKNKRINFCMIYTKNLKNLKILQWDLTSWKM